MKRHPLLMLFRLPAVFTAPADVLAGLALARLAGVEPSLLQACGLVLASVAIYAAGMAANDVCDIKIDMKERSQRPLPSGKVSIKQAWGWIIGLQAAGVGLGALVDLRAGLVVAITVGLTWVYNGWAKHTPLGPLSMGLCRYANAAIGWSLAGWGLVLGWALPLLTLLFVVALTSVSRFEVGVRTARGPLLFLGVMGLLGAAAPLAPPLPRAEAALMCVPAALLLLPGIRAAWSDPTRIGGAVKRGIFTIPLINAAIALGAHGIYEGATILGAAVVGFFFGRWFYAT